MHLMMNLIGRFRNEMDILMNLIGRFHNEMDILMNLIGRFGRFHHETQSMVNY